MKKLGKVFVLLFLVLTLFTGCGNMANTPTKKVEEFLGKYQSMDSEVLTQLDNIIASDDSMSDEQKKNYRAALERQYQNLSYKIKDETIDGDTATVDVEIEVLDYATSISESKKYYQEHPDEFDKKDENNNDNNNDNNDDNNDSLVEDAAEAGEDAMDAVEDAIENSASYIEYKLKQLEIVNDKTKYTITFNLVKEDGEWKVENLSDEDIQKLHGLYEG